jgi:hypothetical protein
LPSFLCNIGKNRQEEQINGDRNEDTRAGKQNLDTYLGKNHIQFNWQFSPFKEKKDAYFYVPSGHAGPESRHLYPRLGIQSCGFANSIRRKIVYIVVFEESFPKDFNYQFEYLFLIHGPSFFC